MGWSEYRKIQFLWVGTPTCSNSHLNFEFVKSLFFFTNFGIVRVSQKQQQQQSGGRAPTVATRALFKEFKFYCQMCHKFGMTEMTKDGSLWIIGGSTEGRSDGKSDLVYRVMKPVEKECRYETEKVWEWYLPHRLSGCAAVIHESYVHIIGGETSGSEANTNHFRFSVKKKGMFARHARDFPREVWASYCALLFEFVCA